MGAVFFYQLSERRLEDVLPPLLEKAGAAFGRVVVRGTEPSRLDRLDADLWRGDGFLPHGVAGGPHDTLQPVLLTTDAALDGAFCLMAVHSAEIGADEAQSMKRSCVIFDGNEARELATARAMWKSLTTAGIEAEYWADEGGWVKKAEIKA